MGSYRYALLGIAVLVAIPVLFGSQSILHEESVKVEEIDAAENILSLRAGCHRLLMTISATQTAAIQRGLAEVKPERPLTHDLLAQILETPGVTFESAEIHSLENGSYRADIILSEPRFQRIDARPSDAVAVALRTGEDIYIDKELLTDEGIDVCDRDGDDI